MSGGDAETVSLGDLSDLADGQMRVFPDIAEHGIVVCRVAGELYAVADNCSHADTPLSEGRLRGAMLVCPLHGAAFDVRDGSHSGPPAYTGLACHRLHVDESGAGGGARARGEVRVEVAPIVDEHGPGPGAGGRFLTR